MERDHLLGPRRGIESGGPYAKYGTPMDLFYRRRASGYPLGPESDRFSGLFSPLCHPLFVLISARATEFGKQFR
jgi:hypothetical protein